MFVFTKFFFFKKPIKGEFYDLKNFEGILEKNFHNY